MNGEFICHLQQQVDKATKRQDADEQGTENWGDGLGGSNLRRLLVKHASLVEAAACQFIPCCACKTLLFFRLLVGLLR